MCLLSMYLSEKRMGWRAFIYVRSKKLLFVHWRSLDKKRMEMSTILLTETDYKEGLQAFVANERREFVLLKLQL